ncbi:MAG TPA: winged helix-turn-helix domain-containing protein [Pyrinomonadaceae bacterium]|nr:winged helix-turn-helix domain-containing protein [Pyrinomonadaceae bacterium]
MAIPLTPKMFELLLILVKNQGHVVEKEDLFKHVWPDSFVEEGNITFNIRQLRKALGDDFQAPRYIETVTRRGYRFIAEVSKVADILAVSDKVDLPGGPPERAYSKSARWTFLVSVVAFAFIFGVVILGIWILGGKTAKAAPILTTPFSLEKLSTDGQVTLSAISRDGKTVVYSQRNAGKQSIWLRQLETSQNTQIVPPSDFLYYGLAFSPDGKSIYFSRGTNSQPDQQTDILRVSILGGIPQRVIGGAQGWMSLSPGGEKISFVRCPRDDQEFCSLWIADSLDGKNEKKLVTRPPPIRIGDNRISPDGKTIAFAVGQSRTGSNDFGLVEVDLESGVERELSSEKFFNINHLVWLPDQKDLLFTARKQSEKNFRIWEVSTTTGEVSILTADSQSYSNLSLSDDGSILVSSQVEPDFRLNVYQTDHPENAPKSLANAMTVNFAPNGKIVFSSQRTSNEEIWSINVDGTDERQLTSDRSDDLAPIVSADNNLIFFVSNRTGKIQIWRMNADGSNQIQLTKNEGGGPLLVSADGQWLYYKAATQKTIMRISTQDGREELVFDKPSVDSVISPDGSRIALSERVNDENMLTVISVADGSTIHRYRVGETKAQPLSLAWSQDGKYLAYILGDQTDNRETLWFQPIDKEIPRRIIDLHDQSVFEQSGLALSPDNKYFAVVQGNWNHNAVLIKGLKQQ